ncbi:MAG: HlyD family efflux transporter periplasmic adaptor subunit [Deltaproteobacteria bacterium]|nr:HlyD family efflux transporter periplasmic adaptor subunit [Candidatus Anaeroferrophillus wilburensis]MBN2889380.1 HlyD family efflux transporter periplasmic adaptor subunit [Deltaproteobacteria bacterium]
MKLQGRSRALLFIPLILLVVVAGLVIWGQHRRRSHEQYYSGTIEVIQANLAFQVPGRVAEVLVDEGQAVKSGQILARLEQKPFLVEVAQGEANLAQVQANLTALEAILALKQETLPWEVSRAEAAAQGVNFQYRELADGYRPQEVMKARLVVDEAQSTLEKVRKDTARADQLFAEKVISLSDKDAQDLRLQTALKQYGQAEQNLTMAEEGFRKESVSASRARLAESRAALELARSNLKQIEVAERQVVAGRAQVSVAAAALEAARIQLSYSELPASFAGILTSRNVEPGEVVTVGREVLSIADLSRVDLKIFVGEPEIGRVKPGQSVAVKIDTFPDKTYTGRVTYISPDSEFTPKIIQTHKERVKLVYLVKVSIDNQNFELKPGMPADAWLQ